MLPEGVFLTAAQVLGGIGIFLLAISMLTQGLQMISGNVLRGVLLRWTRTPLQGLFLGSVVTAILQSSSAVTAIVIGLVNAAVIPLHHAIWVIFGANVGTTMTGWLVSVTGFDFDIKIFALPLVGFGMLMKTFSQRWQINAAGTAIAGFGLFFVGVDILAGAFSAYATQAGFESVSQSGFFSLAVLVAIGFAMTVMTQSSSAATALILTGTAGGMMTLSGGAAMIIGANLGTTSTAVLAVIGASSNARRAAAAHVLFNVLTAVVALSILPFLLVAVEKIEIIFGIVPTPVVGLALFHTVFNLMGVMLLSPLVPVMTRFLEKRFISTEEQDGKPAFLDSTTLNMPAMAMNALIRELVRFKTLACENALDAFAGPMNGKADTARRRRREALSTLSAHITSFSGDLAQEKTAEDTAATLRAALRTNRYLRELASLSLRAEDIRRAIAQEKDIETVEDLRAFLEKCATILNDIAHDVLLARNVMTGFVRSYHKVKENLLEAGARHKISVETLSAMLDHLSAIRRMMEQAIKAQRHLGVLQEKHKIAEPAASAA